MTRTILAAGAVVTRERDGHTEIALIHRPRYDDWTLPKGKLERGEEIHQCAVREVAEETGLRIRLGVPLDPSEYTVGKADKRVLWWRASVLDEQPREADDEVDEVAWLPVAKARKRLSDPDYRRVVDQALSVPETTPVVVLRHGKALSRHRWGKKKPDPLRPLAKRGQAQAAWLVDGLTPWAISDVITSTSTRCEQTVEPYAEAHGLVLSADPTLAEETGGEDHDLLRHAVAAYAASAVRRNAATVICGHRPCLPPMLETLGIPARPFKTGEALICHLDDDGSVVAIEAMTNRRPE